MSEQRQPLHRVGVGWKAKPGAKSIASGSVTVGNLKQKFLICTNARKQKPSDPDFIFLASEPAEVDPYATGDARPANNPPPADPEGDNPFI